MSGVSFGKSEFSVKAGLLSAPDASDKAMSSNGRRGVVKAGFLNGGAGCTTGILGVKNDEGGAGTCCLEGVVGIWVFDSERCGACFAGDEKTSRMTLSRLVRGTWDLAWAWLSKRHRERSTDYCYS